VIGRWGSFMMVLRWASVGTCSVDGQEFAYSYGYEGYAMIALVKYCSHLLELRFCFNLRCVSFFYTIIDRNSELYEYQI
jgi:hypothetical protein